MNEQPTDSTILRALWRLGITWGIASAATYIVLMSIMMFLSPDHINDATSIIAFGIFIGFVNGVTCSFCFIGIPSRGLRLRHWAVVVMIAAICGYGGMSIVHSMREGAFAGSFVLFGLPMGYDMLKLWAARPRGPKGHPDNISY